MCVECTEGSATDLIVLTKKGCRDRLIIENALMHYSFKYSDITKLLNPPPPRAGAPVYQLSVFACVSQQQYLCLVF